jgi:MerR family transcriptional regulator, heat shock protein HspR
VPDHKKIPITDSEPQPSNGSANGAVRATAPVGEKASRRSPVTDLLFDTAPSRERPSADSRRAVYHISIVAEMVETHPQTLRMYERMGLINPQRTRNNVRLYSEADVEQVRRIQHLTQDLGVNLAGVEVVFKLLRELHRLREEMEAELENKNENLSG